VLLFVSNVPVGGPWVGAEHGRESIDGFDLTGGFAGEVDDSFVLAVGEASESGFPSDSSFAVPGGRL